MRELDIIIRWCDEQTQREQRNEKRTDERISESPPASDSIWKELLRRAVSGVTRFTPNFDKEDCMLSDAELRLKVIDEAESLLIELKSTCGEYAKATPEDLQTPAQAGEPLGEILIEQATRLFLDFHCRVFPDLEWMLTAKDEFDQINRFDNDPSQDTITAAVWVIRKVKRNALLRGFAGNTSESRLTANPQPKPVQFTGTLKIDNDTATIIAQPEKHAVENDDLESAPPGVDDTPTITKKKTQHGGSKKPNRRLNDPAKECIRRYKSARKNDPTVTMKYIVMTYVAENEGKTGTFDGLYQRVLAHRNLWRK